MRTLLGLCEVVAFRLEAKGPERPRHYIGGGVSVRVPHHDVTLAPKRYTSALLPFLCVRTHTGNPPLPSSKATLLGMANAASASWMMRSFRADDARVGATAAARRAPPVPFRAPASTEKTAGGGEEGECDSRHVIHHRVVPPRSKKNIHCRLGKNSWHTASMKWGEGGIGSVATAV